MSRTYRAIVKGQHIEWLGEVPDTEGGVPAEVTLLPLPPQDAPDRRRRIRQLLEALASSNALSSITDPVAWQREARQDRPLPGRDHE